VQADLEVGLVLTQTAKHSFTKTIASQFPNLFLRKLPFHLFSKEISGISAKYPMVCWHVAVFESTTSIRSSTNTWWTSNKCQGFEEFQHPSTVHLYDFYVLHLHLWNLPLKLLTFYLTLWFKEFQHPSTVHFSSIFC